MAEPTVEEERPANRRVVVVFVDLVFMDGKGAFAAFHASHIWITKKDAFTASRTG